MADHLRTQIRASLKILLTGLATTGDHVFTSVIQPLEDDDLPAIVLGFPSEEIETPDQLAVKNRKIGRALSYPVTVRVKQIGDVEAVMNEILKEIETAWSADRLLGGLLRDSSMVSIEQNISSLGEKPIGEATLTFIMTYRSLEGAPDISLSGKPRGWMGN